MGTEVKRGRLSSNTHVLIGAGHMGGALLRGWLSGRGSAKLEASEILVIDPAPGESARRTLSLGVKFSKSLTKVTASGTQLALLAIKPQLFKEIGPTLAKSLPKDALIVSIMAGINLKMLQDVFGSRPIVRAMPNTPAAYGKGITAYVCGPGVSKAQEKLAAKRLKVSGDVVAVATEREIDMVTALSGSGPAYVFYLAEAMEAAGIQLGLDPKLVKQLVTQTVIGSGVVMEKSGKEATELRKAVTSPGGTTLAAIEVLSADNGLPSLMRAAVKAAYDRSRKLGGHS